MRRFSVLLVLLSLCAIAHAQEACPWLTQGTAAALMGGDVTSTVHTSAGEGTCEFLRVGGGDHPAAASRGNLKMIVTVSHLPPKQCTAGQRLPGVGQDASRCTTDAEGEHGEIVRGRVRAIYFLLTLTTKEAGGSDSRSLRRAVEQAAEEVAGSLF